MNRGAGIHIMVFFWIIVLVQIVDARHLLKKFSNAGLSCHPKQLASLTKRQLELGLIQFDEANGQHLGIWAPGFPELTVKNNSSVVGAKVQCSLLFLAKALEEVLSDQRNDLNPEDVSLHKTLMDSISRVEMLAACLRSVLGEKCFPPPAPPEMPPNTFERKQWSHTLLTAATHYLQWLQRRLPKTNINRGDFKQKDIEWVRVRVIKGNGFHI